MPFDLPASSPVRLDASVLLFTLAISIATALVFALVPLATMRRLNVQESLKSASRGIGVEHVRTRTRNVLVVAEVALSTTLLIGAGLLIQRLYRIQQERLGFTPEGLITFETPLSPERRNDAVRRIQFARAMLDELHAIAGVRGVAAASLLPLTGQGNLPTQREGRPDQSIGGMEIRHVTPGYFELMGVPVRRGRTLADDPPETATPVAVINETLARAWFPDGDAIGQRIVIGRYQGKEYFKDTPREVIGVVGDTKTMTLKDPPRPTVFLPLSATESIPVSSLSWIVRTTSTPSTADQLRKAALRVDPAQRVRQIRTMQDIVASTTANSRFNASLFGIFSAVALALAAVGIYGLLSFVVAQRRHEIGTRMAVGAQQRDILRLFFRQGLTLAGIGLCAGVTAALMLTRWLAALLHQVQPNDAVSFTAVAVLLLVVGLAATYVPARRATRIDPMVALRNE